MAAAGRPIDAPATHELLHRSGGDSHGCYVIEGARWRGMHATSTKAAASIRSGGFRDGRGESGASYSGVPLFGHGVYLSLDAASANLWRRSQRGAEISCEVHLERVLVYHYSGSHATRMHTSDALAYAAADLGSRIPDLVQELIDDPPAFVTAQGDDLSRWAAMSIAQLWRAVPGEDAHPASRLLTAFGFDAICVLEDVPSLDGGGNQLCVFDPDLVRVMPD